MVDVATIEQNRMGLSVRGTAGYIPEVSNGCALDVVCLRFVDSSADESTVWGVGGRVCGDARCQVHVG